MPITLVRTALAALCAIVAALAVTAGPAVVSYRCAKAGGKLGACS